MTQRAYSSECCSHEPLAAGLAALAHPVRIEIVRHLSGLDACCCKDMVGHLGLAQSTVSQHLKVLVEAGLVRVRAERQSSRYAVDFAALAALSRELSVLTNACAAADSAFAPAAPAGERGDARLG